MKILLKVLVIVVVGLLIGGMFYGVVSAFSSATGLSPTLERQDGGQFTQLRHEDFGGGGGIQFPVQAGKNLALITLICIVYLTASKILDWKKLNFLA